MLTLQDIINEIDKIREALDNIEVRGKNNATLLCYAYGKCDEIINGLNETAMKFQNESQNEPEIKIVEAGEENGE